MSQSQGFWTGMPANIKMRFIAGLIYLLVVLAVFGQSPISGVVLLVLPVLWTVSVIWLGSENGFSFGPYRQRRETAFSYTLRHLWHSSVLTRAIVGFLVATSLIGGLGWISTEKLRAKDTDPTLTERVSTVAENATNATKEKARGWYSTAKGWFSSED